MANLTARTDVFDTATTQGNFRSGIGAIHDVLNQQPGVQAETEFTISGGSIAPTVTIISVDTESDAASDNLDTIDPSNLHTDAILFLHINNASRSVVLRHGQGGTGQIITSDAADITLDATTKWLILHYDSANTQWLEMFRSFSGSSSSDANAIAYAIAL